MSLNISVGDIITFQRYGKSMKGEVTKLFDKSDTIIVDNIHWTKRYQVIRIEHR